MSGLILYAHPTCSTCRAARAWLLERGLAFTERDIRTTPPPEAALRTMLAAQDGALRRLFNTSGMEYRSLGLAQSLPGMTPAAALRLLAGNGMLVKRPFLLGPGVALVGFKPDVWQGVLG